MFWIANKEVFFHFLSPASQFFKNFDEYKARSVFASSLTQGRTFFLFNFLPPLLPPQVLHFTFLLQILSLLFMTTSSLSLFFLTLSLSLSLSFSLSLSGLINSQLKILTPQKKNPATLRNDKWNTNRGHENIAKGKTLNFPQQATPTFLTYTCHTSQKTWHWVSLY